MKLLHPSATITACSRSSLSLKIPAGKSIGISAGQVLVGIPAMAPGSSGKAAYSGAALSPSELPCAVLMRKVRRVVPPAGPWGSIILETEPATGADVFEELNYAKLTGSSTVSWQGGAGDIVVQDPGELDDAFLAATASLDVKRSTSFGHMSTALSAAGAAAPQEQQLLNASSNIPASSIPEYPAEISPSSLVDLDIGNLLEVKLVNMSGLQVSFAPILRFQTGPLPLEIDYKFPIPEKVMSGLTGTFTYGARVNITCTANIGWNAQEDFVDLYKSKPKLTRPIYIVLPWPPYLRIPVALVGLRFGVKGMVSVGKSMGVKLGVGLQQSVSMKVEVGYTRSAGLIFEPNRPDPGDPTLFRDVETKGMECSVGAAVAVKPYVSLGVSIYNEQGDPFHEGWAGLLEAGPAIEARVDLNASIRPENINAACVSCPAPVRVSDSDGDKPDDPATSLVRVYVMFTPKLTFEIVLAAAGKLKTLLNNKEAKWDWGLPLPKTWSKTGCYNVSESLTSAARTLCCVNRSAATGLFQLPALPGAVLAVQRPVAILPTPQPAPGAAEHLISQKNGECKLGQGNGFAWDSVSM